MAKKAAGIIFSNLNNTTLSRLTSDRTVAAIPFACRYRLVDFALSNMINSDISNINIIVNYNYRSLVEHIGSGKDWDLARRGGGINIISPYQTSRNSTADIFYTHLEALKNIKEYIDELKEEYVVLTDTDFVLNIDLSLVIKAHESSGAAVTFVTKPISVGYTSKVARMMVSSIGGRITDISMNSSYNPKNPELAINIFVMKTSYLRKIIEDARSHSMRSLTKVFLSNVRKENYHTYCAPEYIADVSSFLDYYRCSMELVNDYRARESLLFKKEAPIFTKVHNSAPTNHKSTGRAENSIIADECIIEGTVINSVIFRGVYIAKGATVKNSVLFHGTHVSKNAELHCIVTDKDVYISEGVHLSGNENTPFYIEKQRKV